MLSGFYTAASGVLTQQRILNVLSSNVVNAKTPGYRAQRVVSGTFDHELLTRVEAGRVTEIGVGSPMVRVVQELPTNFQVSSMEETGRLLDFAIKGEGYFNIRTAADEEAGEDPEQMPVYLTRGGTFALDEEGYLVLEGVGRVLGQDGEIQITGGGFAVDPDGTIYNSRGRRVDTLLVTNPNEEATVSRGANGLYTVDPPASNVEVEAPQVLQGMLERSNLDVNRELTLTMEAQRAFQSCSQALKIVDGMNQKAAAQIAAL